MAASMTSLASTTALQSVMDDTLRVRAVQQQPQEVNWNNRRRLPINAAMASVTQLLIGFDIYKRKQGVQSLHECCGIEVLTLLESVTAVDISDAADGDEPLRNRDTFETPETFDSRFKAECKALAMTKGKQANVKYLQNYLSDFYSLIQIDRRRIEDLDDPDFNHTLIFYFMANVEPSEMRNKMQEFRASTFSAALKRFRSI